MSSDIWLSYIPYTYIIIVIVVKLDKQEMKKKSLTITYHD